MRLRLVPIVALTASAMKGDDRKASDAGCAGYITKPIDTREFPRQVRSFLPAALRPGLRRVNHRDPADRRWFTAEYESCCVHSWKQRAMR